MPDIVASPPQPSTIKVPPNGVTGTLNCEDVRHLLMDRSIADNPLELDLSFSDDEIGWAFRYAAMQYNSIPPFVGTVRDPIDVVDPKLAYPFMISTLYHLCLSKSQQLSRQDVDYSAGDMQVDFTKRRIEYLTKWAQSFKEESTTAMKNYKLVANLEQGYAHF